MAIGQRRPDARRRARRAAPDPGRARLRPDLLQARPLRTRARQEVRRLLRRRRPRRPGLGQLGRKRQAERREQLCLQHQRREQARHQRAEPGGDRPERRHALPDRRPPRPVDLLRGAGRRRGAARARDRQGQPERLQRQRVLGRDAAPRLHAPEGRQGRGDHAGAVAHRPGPQARHAGRRLSLAGLFHARHRLQQADALHRLPRVLLGRLAARATSRCRATR